MVSKKTGKAKTTGVHAHEFIPGVAWMGLCTKSLDFKPFLLIAPLFAFFFKKI